MSIVKVTKLTKNSNNMAVIMLYHKGNRYSYHAILGSLEKHQIDEKVNIIILNTYHLKNHGELEKALHGLSIKYEKIIVLLSLMSTQLPDRLSSFRVINHLKEKLEKQKKKFIFVIGGPHSSGDPIGTLELGADIVFIGESEIYLSKLIEKILESKYNDSIFDNINDVKGIVYRVNSDIIYTGPQEPCNLDDYPPFSVRYKMFSPIEITRGCSFGCLFCETPFLFGGKVRHRNIETIKFYVKTMIENNKKDVRFITPNAMSYGSKLGNVPDYDAVKNLVLELNEFKQKYRIRIFLGSFPSEVRPEHINYEIMSFLRKYLNNDRIIVGAQSGSDYILRKINRGHTTNDVENAVKILRPCGFIPDVDFIFGLPGESKKELYDTIRFMDKLVSMGARIHAHSFLPLPGTPFEDYKPRQIPQEIKNYIFKIAGRGHAYGQWERQEKTALELWKLRLKGIIMSRKLFFELRRKKRISIEKLRYMNEHYLQKLINESQTTSMN